MLQQTVKKQIESCCCCPNSIQIYMHSIKIRKKYTKTLQESFLVIRFTSDIYYLKFPELSKFHTINNFYNKE